MDVRKNIQQIFNIYLQNFILLVLASSITGLISFVSLRYSRRPNDRRLYGAWNKTDPWGKRRIN